MESFWILNHFKNDFLESEMKGETKNHQQDVWMLVGGKGEESLNALEKHLNTPQYIWMLTFNYLFIFAILRAFLHMFHPNFIFYPFHKFYQL